MPAQDALIKFCLHCGEKHVTAELTACVECDGPLVKQNPLGEYE